MRFYIVWDSVWKNRKVKRRHEQEFESKVMFIVFEAFYKKFVVIILFLNIYFSKCIISLPINNCKHPLDREEEARHYSFTPLSYDTLDRVVLKSQSLFWSLCFGFHWIQFTISSSHFPLNFLCLKVGIKWYT